VIPLLLFVAVVGGLMLRGMSPEERIAFLHRVIEWGSRVKAAITYLPPECQPFNDALRARTRWTIVTPAIAATNIVIFLGMAFGTGALAERDTLLAWGASVGPRTTNGEWWRLLTSTFVHMGVIHVLASVAGTLRAGLMLERLVGHVALATTYVSAGILGGLATVAIHPVALHAGASGAVFGIYGLLLASIGWGMVRPSEVTIPRAALRQLAPGAVIFLLYTFITEGLVTPAMITGLTMGVICGVVLAGGVTARKPPVRRVVATFAATAGIVVVLAVPLRGVADVTAEIAQVVAVERQISHDYDAAIDTFKKERRHTEVLIEQIDRIRPELRTASARLNGLVNVPGEQLWLVSGAKEYLRLRDESWRLRAEGLRQSSMRLLQQADSMERAALDALEMIEPAEPN
jgi:membrane associated rhomboid family serine protease